MCRSTDYQHSQTFVPNLSVKAFFLRFSGLGSCAAPPLPDSLTLVYLPRFSETKLEVSGSKIRPDSPAFLTLHRVVRSKAGEGEAIYGSTERVRAGDGVRFEVYSREEKVLTGIFRKDDAGEWKLECKCALQTYTGMAGLGAQVCVAVEGHMTMGERVAMVVRRQRKGFDVLEEIPEEREAEMETDSDDKFCCPSCGESESDGEDLEEGFDGEVEMDLEGVRWTVELGIWVMCLGVGYLVSKVSAKSFRGMRLLRR